MKAVCENIWVFQDHCSSVLYTLYKKLQPPAVSHAMTSGSGLKLKVFTFFAQQRAIFFYQNNQSEL